MMSRLNRNGNIRLFRERLLPVEEFISVSLFSAFVTMLLDELTAAVGAGAAVLVKLFVLPCVLPLSWLEDIFCLIPYSIVFKSMKLKLTDCDSN
jgi:hypothetical protein